MTEQEQARLKEDGWPLPDDAFIICGRLDEQFEFIRAGLGDGSPVWYYSESAPAPVVEYPSFAEWLNANLEGAIEAQASGYFEKSWRGPER